MIYRKDVDGLRTLAVVPVVLFHAGLLGFAGGYAGVDVFFVISGFLITTLLLEDLHRDRFSILGFYERRARRIIPALTLVVAASTVMAALTLPPPRLEEYGASMMATAFFGANVYFWRTTDYFATSAEERPLLHMWSLAVEEQFYIVFPLVLLALWRWRKNGSDATLWYIFIGVAVLSFALAVFSAGWKPVANFYLPVTRAWELLAGSLVALATKGKPPTKTPYAPWLAGLGLILVIGALTGLDDATLWPGPWTVLPVAGTALILAFARADCPTGFILSWRPMVWIGLLSYSIYLWHQPLLAFARITMSGQPPLWLMASLAVSTVPLAWLSWYFVEQPFRTRPAAGGFSRRAIFTTSAASLAVITAIGIMPIGAPQLTENLYTARLSDEDRERYTVLQTVSNAEMTQNTEISADRSCRHRFSMVTPAAKEMLLRCTANGQRAVIVTGGSHAGDLYDALAVASEVEVIIGFTRGYCRPHRRLGKPAPHECPYDGVRNLMAAHPDRVALVVYTQAGFTVFDDYRNLRGTEGLHMNLVEEVGDYLETLIAHVPVLALGPRPILGIDPRHLSITEPFEPQIVRAQDPSISEAMSAVNRAFSETFAVRGVSYLSHADAINTILPDEAIIEGMLTYKDKDHWSFHGERIFGARLVAKLQAMGYEALFPSD